MTVHVYLKYGHDKFGEYIEKIYSPVIMPETDDLEYLGEIDKSKQVKDDGKTYI